MGIVIHQAAEAIGSFLITHGLPNEKKEIYVYGAECFINLVLCDSLLFLWAFVCRCVPEFLLWLISFTALRNHIGGFHAKTHWQCITFSVCIGIISVSLRWVWTVHIFLTVIILCICLIAVIQIAPVLHPNHSLSFDRRDRERAISIVVLVIELIVIAALYHWQLSWCGATVSGVIGAMVLAVIGYYVNMK